MKGLKCINRKKTTITIFGFLFSALLSVFLFSPSYATSVDCSPTLSGTTFDLTSCDFSTLDASKTWYYKADFNVLSTTSSATWYYNFPAIPQGNYVFRNASFTSVHVGQSFTVLVSDFGAQSVCIMGNLGCGHFTTLVADSGSLNKSIELVSLRVLDDIADCPPCPSCPPIPANPYDNKFDEIKQAIYTCGAIMIVLYFFWGMYRIIIKTGGK